MSTKDHVLDFIAVWHESSPRGGHGSGGSTCSLFFNLALEPSHLRHSARVLTTSHVPTHNTGATKHSGLSHSLRVIRIASCAFTFWMLRCLLVALRRSGCACCYGSVPTIVVRLELAIVSHVIGDNFAAVCGGRSRLGYSVLPIGFCMLDPGVGGLVPRSSGCLRVFGTICPK